MMEYLRLPFLDYTFCVVAFGSGLLGMVSGMLGSFAVLRGQGLLGDGVSHAALPGVALAFLLTGGKSTGILLLGALCTGLLAALCVLGIARHSRVKFDGALALVLSVFFGVGLMLLTCLQKVPDAGQAGLNRFLFGQASTLLPGDLVLLGGGGGALLLAVLLFWKELGLLCFDPDYAGSIGFSPGRLDLLLSGLMAAGIVLGLQTVGVVLMSAMLIAPGVAARQWTRRLWSMTLLAGIFGAFSGVAGSAVSSLAAKLPTGPCIVVWASGIAAVSLLLAPGRGILHRLWHRACLKQKGRENDASAN